ncbi:Smr/MutS family protein [Paralcaligenes ginsengisoli]
MREHKGGLGELKRLRQEAAAPKPAIRPTAPASTPKGAREVRKAMQTQPSSLDIDDKALFLRAVKGVERLRDPRRAVLPPMPTAPSHQLQQRREAATGPTQKPLAQTSDHFAPAGLIESEPGFVRNPGSADLLKGLKRGKWPIGATLDLHGATLDEARTRLDQFLQSCLAHHIRCVCVVHGKGYGSKNGTPVLKQTIRRWLTQLDCVQAYAECREQDGGAGAVQVLLRPGPATN